jgi:hypothetical protein
MVLGSRARRASTSLWRLRLSLVLEKIAESVRKRSRHVPASSGRMATIRKTPNPPVTSSDHPAHRHPAHHARCARESAKEKLKEKCWMGPKKGSP